MCQVAPEVAAFRADERKRNFAGAGKSRENRVLGGVAETPVHGDYQAGRGEIGDRHGAGKGEQEEEEAEAQRQTERTEQRGEGEEGEARTEKICGYVSLTIPLEANNVKLHFLEIILTSIIVITKPGIFIDSVKL